MISNNGWVKFGALSDGRFQVIRPVAIRFRKENRGWYAWSGWLLEWGFGPTKWHAAMDLMLACVQTIEILEGEKLRAGMQSQLNRLNQYFQRRKISATHKRLGIRPRKGKAK